MKTTNIIAAALTCCTLAAGANAPVANRKALTLEGARQVIAAGVAAAKSRNSGGSFAVVDPGGNIVALERTDSAFPASGNIATGKARTAALFRKPTKFFEEVVAKGRTSMVTLPDFTPLQGGVPLVMDGEVVGAVGVSGAASAQEDEEFANIAAAALQTAPRQVSHIEGANVKAAFAKGMPLIEVGEYKIHASRREAPGQAEIHERDTDIVHVLSGAATLVTGGRATSSKTIAPEEIRGDAIEGGQRRRLAPGDVVVIPNGVPHQFLDVEAPLQYYFVKVRI